jgi:hypothetical protein
MNPEDLDLLRRIQEGERVFSQNAGQPYDRFEREVLRLLRLRDQRLITMHPDPLRSSMTARSEYLKTGVCALTLEGHEALERFT